MHTPDQIKKIEDFIGEGKYAIFIKLLEKESFLPGRNLENECEIASMEPSNEGLSLEKAEDLIRQSVSN